MKKFQKIIDNVNDYYLGRQVSIPYGASDVQQARNWWKEQSSQTEEDIIIEQRLLTIEKLLESEAKKRNQNKFRWF